MNQKWSEKTTLQKVMEIIAGIAFLENMDFEHYTVFIAAANAVSKKAEEAKYRAAVEAGKT